MKKLLTVLFGILLGLSSAGLLILVSSPPRGHPVILLPPPTPAPLIVHVVGGVRNPGVFTLDHGSRVETAINAAGGLLPEAWSGSINLAERLYDGQQILVYVLAPSATPREEQTRSPGIVSTADPSIFLQVDQLININTASETELEELPGIGPVTAQKIIEHRQIHGLFTDIHELKNVSGIGPATFERIKDLITIGILP